MLCEDNLDVIEDMKRWVSPRLGIRFEVSKEMARERAKRLEQLLREAGIEPNGDFKVWLQVQYPLKNSSIKKRSGAFFLPLDVELLFYG